MLRFSKRLGSGSAYEQPRSIFARDPEMGVVARTSSGSDAAGHPGAGRQPGVRRIRTAWGAGDYLLHPDPATALSDLHHAEPLGRTRNRRQTLPRLNPGTGAMTSTRG